MMTIIFIKDWPAGTTDWRAGQVANVDDAFGHILIRDGVAKERKEVGPEETKTPPAEEGE